MATMTMAPTSAFEPSPTLPRAHSSAALPSLASQDFKRSEQVSKAELPRSASFSSVPGLLENPSYVPNNDNRNLSSESLPLPTVSNNRLKVPGISEHPEGEVKAEETKIEEARTEQQTKNERPKMGRRKSLVARPKSWIMRVKGTPENSIPEMSVPPPSMPDVPKLERAKMEKSKSEKSKQEKIQEKSPEKGKGEIEKSEKKENVTPRQQARLSRAPSTQTHPKDTRARDAQNKSKTPARSNRKSWFGGAPTVPTVIPATPTNTATTSTSRSPSPTKMATTDVDSSSREDEDVSTAPSSLDSSSPRLAVVQPVEEAKPTLKAPEPAPVAASAPATPEDPPSTAASSDSRPNSVPLPTFTVTDAPTKPPSRRGTILQKMKRPSSMLVTTSQMKTANFSTSSLPPASMPVSATGSPGSLSPRESMERVPTIPKTAFSTSSEKLLEIPRKKDELWSSFRSLDTDYQKFQSKSSALKTNVVRSSLLPFLRNHAHHPSNKMLRPEDVDRRVNILNKWWTGILEMLDGQSNQTVSGVDRPVLLEAITGIMTRPEWRLAPSHFAPLNERTTTRAIPRSRSSGSLNSTASAFLAESVFHNVRNTFIQNLLSQISLVVDKMSLRHAPASLVTFCGKAAAYAFFFCPGVGEQLAQLWSLPANTLRRVVDEFEIPRGVSKTEYSEELISAFPPTMQSMGWTSVAQAARQLRQKPNLPLGAAKINWQGPWIARWCGRDSDLFFVFCKHYHILVEEFLPTNLPLKEKARAPGFVFVHAQILTALDMTIHRQSTGDAPIPITFDDVLGGGADASATTIPLPSSNVTRLMAENRLIMLLRDFLSERPSDFENSRHIFAESFGRMTRAAAKGTSLFDHNGCFVLCDFLEEALAIYIRYHSGRVKNASPEESLLILHQDFIDWEFWLEVCKRILLSQNTMSEIRLFSFIYTAWNILVADEKRKEVLCLDWLLHEDTFERMFGHWCPMVRAYYMRLLCWRVARHDGEATPLDTKILAALYDRLKQVWAHFLYLRQDAIENNRIPPSSAPCLPAPGRRLFIIRNDHQNPAPGLFLGFDGIVPPSLTSVNSKSAKRHSMLSVDQMNGGPVQAEKPMVSEVAPTPKTPIVLSPPPPEPTSPPQKKKWSILGRLSPFSSSSAPKEATAAAPVPAKSSTTTAELAAVRAETAASRTPNKLTKSRSPSPSGSTDTLPLSPSAHRAFCFKFSLEWHQQPPNVGPQKNLRLAPPRLPAPAHSWLGNHVPNVSNPVQPKAPMGIAVSPSKYSGRAIAEWTVVVMECNNFTERRRSEGVPNLKCIEIPTLGIEGFRKFI